MKSKRKKLPPCPPCWICNDPRSEWDHIVTRAAASKDRKDAPYNLQPLCRPHHTEKGMAGVRSFVRKYNLPISWERSGWPERTDLTISSPETS